jgi:YteA family regulatory protein
MNQLTDKQLQTLKDRLTEEKNELQRHFEINGTSGEKLNADSGGELSSYDNHPADMGTETFERERDHAIDENLDQKLAAVEAALQRIDEGTYGGCELCLQPIPYERLQALPWTATCLEHAGMTEGKAIPAERYEMTAPILPDEAGTWAPLNRYGSSDNEVPGQREES